MPTAGMPSAAAAVTPTGAAVPAPTSGLSSAAAAVAPTAEMATAAAAPAPTKIGRASCRERV